MEIIDNFLERKDVEFVFKYCFASSYTYGEIDDITTPPTGMIHHIKSSETIYNLFESKIRDSYDIVQGMNLYRMYINCFAPSENPYFHKDGDNGLTFLYYFTNHVWGVHDGGETQFLIDDEIKGVLPLPNRIVGFDCVEVCPPHDNGNTSALAARLIRHLVGAVWQSQQRFK